MTHGMLACYDTATIVLADLDSMTAGRSHILFFSKVLTLCVYFVYCII